MMVSRIRVIEQHARTHPDPVFKDINDRMPRQEAKAIFDLIKPIGDVVWYTKPPLLNRILALKIDPKLFIEIMGSYRR
jgi:DNA polymerase lambda